MTDRATVPMDTEIAEIMEEIERLHPPISLPTWDGHELFGEQVQDQWFGYVTGGPAHLEILWRLTAGLAELTSLEQAHHAGRTQELVRFAEDRLKDAERYLREALVRYGDEGQPPAGPAARVG